MSKKKLDTSESLLHALTIVATENRDLRERVRELEKELAHQSLKFPIAVPQECPAPTYPWYPTYQYGSPTCTSSSGTEMLNEKQS